MISFSMIAAYFIIYAVIGWGIEVIYATFKTKTFINRGFLNGPICPIYGAGATLVIVCLISVKNNIILLYLAAVFLTSFIEFITGFILEKIFHQKWWDYSMRPLNIKGYVCLRFSLLWGVACVVVIKLIQPVVDGVLAYIKTVGIMFEVVLIVSYLFLALDIIVTIIALMKIHTRLRLINDIDRMLVFMSESVGQVLSDETLKGIEDKEKLQKRYENMIALMKKKHGENYQEYLAKIDRIHKRLEKAFPELDFSRFDFFADKIEKIKASAEKGISILEKTKDDIAGGIESIKNEITENIKNLKK